MPAPVVVVVEIETANSFSYYQICASRTGFCFSRSALLVFDSQIFFFERKKIQVRRGGVGGKVRSLAGPAVIAFVLFSISSLPGSPLSFHGRNVSPPAAAVHSACLSLPFHRVPLDSFDCRCAPSPSSLN